MGIQSKSEDGWVRGSMSRPGNERTRDGSRSREWIRGQPTFLGIGIVSKGVGVKSGRVNGIWFYGFKVSECC